MSTSRASVLVSVRRKEYIPFCIKMVWSRDSTTVTRAESDKPIQVNVSLYSNFVYSTMTTVNSKDVYFSNMTNDLEPCKPV
jgi:hypothetical protein